MRIAILAAAFGMTMGLTALAPAPLMSAAIAQAGPTQAQIDALENEILNAPDQASIDAIIARETAAGNFDLLAQGLAEAAVIMAETDLSGAASLVVSAIAAAESGSDDAQIDVGVAASTVATTADDNGDTATADVVETAVNNSTDPDVGSAYTIVGGKDGDAVTYSGPTDTTTTTGGDTTTGDDDTTTTGDDDDTTTTGDDTTTTTGGDTTTTTPTPAGGAITPPPPPPPSQPTVPVVPEPNPSQSSDSPV